MPLLIMIDIDHFKLFNDTYGLALLLLIHDLKAGNGHINYLSVISADIKEGYKMSIDLKGYTALITGSSGMGFRWQELSAHSATVVITQGQVQDWKTPAVGCGAGCTCCPNGCQRRGLCHKSGRMVPGAL